MGPVDGSIRRGQLVLTAAQVFGSSDNEEYGLPDIKRPHMEGRNASLPAPYLANTSIVNSALPISSLTSSQVPWSSSPSWHNYSAFQLNRGYHTSAQPGPEVKLEKSIYFMNGGNIAHDDIAPQEPLAEEKIQFDITDTLSSQIRAQQRDKEAELGEIVEDNDEALPEVLSNVSPREIFLSEEQKYVLDLVVRQRQSIFFTGAAGTGKSVLLRRIISDLRRKARDPSKVAVTASTGIAAFNIGGSTLHRFAGIGLGKDDPEALLKKVRYNRQAKMRWKSINTLIIDEISMIQADLLDKLDFIARKIRQVPDKPFGGIQMVFTGDFFQLPPVIQGGDENTKTFAFDAECWKPCVQRTIVLKQVFRQKDTRFSSMLDEMRRGVLSPETIATFKSLDRPPRVPPGVMPTQLFPRRFEVERANENALKSLGGVCRVYDCVDEYNEDFPFKVKLDDLLVPPQIKLKVGAQVMMLKNVDSKLVNGSVGKVLGFMNESTYAMYQETELEGLDEEDSIDMFDASVMGADHNGNNSDTVLKRKRAKAHYLNQMSNTGEGRTLPLVEFRNLDGTSRTVLVTPEVWTVEDAEGHWMARRTQVPLILAWALSIHKSQGQTLEYAQVDLGNIFERGQAYVALSRVTSLDGLQVKRFNPHKVTVHERVLEFYDSLEEVQIGGRQMTMFEAFRPRPDPEVDHMQEIAKDSDEAIESLRAYMNRPEIPLTELGDSISDDSDFDVDKLHATAGKSKQTSVRDNSLL
ncbi:ATP-dependent DNA helicase PIF1 [Wickerhamiella sorbophila]|uniref:ATP-dependent DNA helicase PIF1 n=1 Tax=Wickerhamiella sorbophila TaxID=45607 RepID=A0A2T0FMF4_9ASCO|nr:ATP-dependent DNA helicase PIF1 [Wickerhamiella sorbophila]PRT56155.1 ATP-dependent DNA helicase PIF1 [Wickerhamiella sorbophila]